VFLAGDAAHRVTPRGGTGLNMAIHGGFDLGWKLAWVLRGWASDRLLDSYEAERRPVARHNIERSIDPGGAVREVADEVRVDLGGRIPHAWITAGTSTLDVLSGGLTLLASGPSGRIDLGAGPPVDVRQVDPMTARALGGTTLVRPDGAPLAWFGPADDREAGLRAAVATALDRPRGVWDPARS
jgi:hypothetical protein